jgi:hypothetical protein
MGVHSIRFEAGLNVRLGIQWAALSVPQAVCATAVLLTAVKRGPLACQHSCMYLSSTLLPAGKGGTLTFMLLLLLLLVLQGRGCCWHPRQEGRCD